MPKASVRKRNVAKPVRVATPGGAAVCAGSPRQCRLIREMILKALDKLECRLWKLLDRQRLSEECLLQRQIDDLRLLLARQDACATPPPTGASRGQRTTPAGSRRRSGGKA